MSFYSAKKKIKNIAAFLIILIFLPYVVSIFVNGKDVNLQNGSGHFTIKVARTDPDGTELDLDLDWEEYLIGVLAYEMPESYELEALKAQAVVLRTSLCRELAENEEKTATEKYLTHAEMKRKWGAANFDTYLKKYTKAGKEMPEYTPDFVKLAESYGAKGIRVMRKEDIAAAFEQAKKETKIPTLIEFIIDPEELVYPMVKPNGTLEDMIMDC